MDQLMKKILSLLFLLFCLSMKDVDSLTCHFNQTVINSPTDTDKVYDVKIYLSGLVVRMESGQPPNTTTVDSRMIYQKVIKPGELLQYTGTYDIDNVTRGIKMYVTKDNTVFIAYQLVEKDIGSNRTEACKLYKGNVSPPQQIKVVISKETTSVSTNVNKKISMEYQFQITPTSSGSIARVWEPSTTWFTLIMATLVVFFSRV